MPWVSKGFAKPEQCAFQSRKQKCVTMQDIMVVFKDGFHLQEKQINRDKAHIVSIKGQGFD